MSHADCLLIQTVVNTDQAFIKWATTWSQNKINFTISFSEKVLYFLV